MHNKLLVAISNKVTANLRYQDCVRAQTEAFLILALLDGFYQSSLPFGFKHYSYLEISCVGSLTYLGN